MEVFLKALLIIVILAAIIGLVALILISDAVCEWFIDILIGAAVGIGVAFVLGALIIDPIVAIAGDNNTYKAGRWVVILIGIAVTAFVAIWLHENTNLSF